MSFSRLLSAPRVRLAVLALLVAIGCAAQQRSLPALTTPATNEHRTGEFVWFDLLVDDPDKAKAFYGKLFGWTFEPLGDGDYDTIMHGGRAIGALIQHEPDDDTEPDDIWLPSLSVTNVDEAAKRARADGGSIVLQPRNFGARGRLAILRDPEGATFAVMRSKAGDPGRQAAGAGDFVWVQLWTRDHEVPVSFYDDVAGWHVGEVLQHDEIEEGFFEVDGKEVASVIELPWKNVHPNWLPYVGVDDVEKSIERVKELGGRVLVKGEYVAIVQDPEGAAIGIAPIGAQEGSDR